MIRLFAVLAALIFASPLTAQTYPDRTADGVNDFADIIDAGTETRIIEKLADIADGHDTEVVIVTLSSVRFYAQNTDIAEYATNLFNTWGIGDAEANTGILILVFRDDGLMRIETGSGYDAAALAQVDLVVSEDIIGHFRDDDFAQGLEAGVDGLLARLIDPPAANDTATPTTDTTEGSGGTLYYILGAIVAGIAGLVGLNRRSAAKFAAQPCSSCGKPGLVKSREVLRAATLETEGAGETRITCPSCGHVDVTPYTISKLRPEAPKGGGKSEGGGTTGKF
ncbi:TPM domain-containing protein [Octadecabacter sp. 1_MG-2023]|uniref:TPM domain-containing protein n=1 Tax=unclassified Octadecabacter TaxID=196158 RepID=UPI001C08F160|nr:MULTISPECIES: TPM domain-containing protein [unclassified Octadecabacter]MBU2993415.1 TPM domain-containing protein [Octadecabacter sp. B2R22]MDO6733129.1 TPM domain-containing protein [Octadecabacter sp. 1_MG-2023]